MSDKQIVWFVRGGEMYSGWVLASLTFEFELVDGSGNDDKQYAGQFMAPEQGTKSIPRGVINMMDRPGTWLLLSGDRVVHSSDVYGTRQIAAKVEYERLAGEIK